MTLSLAMVLDAILGDPRWLWSRAPHPAAAIGRAIELFEARFGHGERRRLAGAAGLALLCLLAVLAGLAVGALPGGAVLEVLLAAVLLAQRSLAQHVRAVADALRLSLGDGRLAVARIVGRDTGAMDGPDVARAAIESAGENLSDGVIAPAFWFLVGGLPGMLLYKAANTADSMIGHRTERHGEFGWAAARFDDLLNWIPARIAAFLVAALHGALGQWRDIAGDAGLHRSPNAGWPEAAMARAVDTALAGPRSYGGRAEDFAFVHPAGRMDPGPREIDASVTVLWRAWAAALAAIVLLEAAL